MEVKVTKAKGSLKEITETNEEKSHQIFALEYKEMIEKRQLQISFP